MKIPRTRSEALEWARKCDGKKRYPTQQAADQHARSLRKQEKRSNATAYYCEFCDGFHVGHKRPE